jgi:hypothetical protein
MAGASTALAGLTEISMDLSCRVRSYNEPGQYQRSAASGVSQPTHFRQHFAKIARNKCSQISDSSPAQATRNRIINRIIISSRDKSKRNFKISTITAATTTADATTTTADAIRPRPTRSLFASTQFAAALSCAVFCWLLVIAKSSLVRVLDFEGETRGRRGVPPSEVCRGRAVCRVRQQAEQYEEIKNLSSSAP